MAFSRSGLDPSTVSEELKAQIGQHFILGFHSSTLSSSPTLSTLLKDYKVGSLILMKRNFTSPSQLSSLIHDSQILAKAEGHPQPLMIGMDQEGGIVSPFSIYEHGSITKPSAGDDKLSGGTFFPGAMTLAATGDAGLAKKTARAAAKEMRLCGINWAFAPTVDVNVDERNPVIGIRSYSSSPATVSQFSIAFSGGLSNSNVAPAPKHFPGHGDTAVDSHLGLPIIHKTKEQLEVTELRPFKELISQAEEIDSNGGKGFGTSHLSLMTAHIALPSLHPPNDSSLPATLSSTILTDLLRKELDFQGVVVTDCLEMDAIASLPGGVAKATIDTIMAGSDIVMICHTTERMKAAIEACWELAGRGEDDKEGREFRKRLRESDERIRKFKLRWTGGWEMTLGPEGTSTKGLVEKSWKIGGLKRKEWETIKIIHRELSAQAYRQSTTIIRDPRQIIPLRVSSSSAQRLNILLFTPLLDTFTRLIEDAEDIIRSKDGKSIRNTSGPSFSTFSKLFQSRINDVPGSAFRHFVYARDDADVSKEVLDSFSGFTHIVFCTANAFPQPSGIWQLRYLHRIVQAAKKEDKNIPVSVLATAAPYDLLNPEGKEFQMVVESFGNGEETVDWSEMSYICSYEYTIPALENACKVLLGEVEAKGKCPV